MSADCEEVCGEGVEYEGVMEKIKPCMYCGNKYAPYFEVIHDYIAEYGHPRDGEPVTVFRVKCRYCHAQSAIYYDRKAPVAYWNALSDLAHNQGFDNIKARFDP